MRRFSMKSLWWALAGVGAVFSVLSGPPEKPLVSAGSQAFTRTAPGGPAVIVEDTPYNLTGSFTMKSTETQQLMALQDARDYKQQALEAHYSGKLESILILNTLNSMLYAFERAGFDPKKEEQLAKALKHIGWSLEDYTRIRKTHEFFNSCRKECTIAGSNVPDLLVG